MAAIYSAAKPQLCIADGIVGMDGDDRNGGIPRAAHVDQLGQQIRLDERHVAGQDEDLGHVLWHDRNRGPHGIGRAARFRLEHKVRLVGEDFPDDFRRGRVDNERVPPTDLARGVQNVAEHGAAAQLVKNLGLARFHARSEAGGKHNRQNASECLVHRIGR